jgi:hypothetical protein
MIACVICNVDTILANIYWRLFKDRPPGEYLNFCDILENTNSFTAQRICKQLKHNMTSRYFEVGQPCVISLGCCHGWVVDP